MTDSIALDEAMAEALRGIDHLNDPAARNRAYVAAGIEIHAVSREHAEAADERARSIVLIERMGA